MVGKGAETVMYWWIVFRITEGVVGAWIGSQGQQARGSENLLAVFDRDDIVSFPEQDKRWNPYRLAWQAFAAGEIGNCRIYGFKVHGRGQHRTAAPRPTQQIKGIGFDHREAFEVCGKASDIRDLIIFGDPAVVASSLASGIQGIDANDQKSHFRKLLLINVVARICMSRAEAAATGHHHDHGERSRSLGLTHVQVRLQCGQRIAESLWQQTKRRGGNTK